MERTMTKRILLNGFMIAASIAAMSLAVMPATVSAAGSRFSNSTTTRDANNNICLNFEDVEVILPSDWAGKCRMVTYSDFVSFYHLASNDKLREEGYSTGGLLFNINYSTDQGYVNGPDYMTIGASDGGYYYATFPTDVQAYTGDQTIASEYFALFSDIEWIKANMSLVHYGDSEAVWVDPDSSDEYIFPQSSSEYLTAEDFAGMDAKQIQMAINEIYARHGRKFVMTDVQEYFNSLSWYVGTVEAADFDVSVMNQYEGANINLMVELLEFANQNG